MRGGARSLGLDGVEDERLLLAETVDVGPVRVCGMDGGWASTAFAVRRAAGG